MRSLYAMDTFFYNSAGAYSFETRCKMLRELGYDAAYLTLWDEQAWRDVGKLPDVRDRYGLDVEAVYVVLDICRPPDDPQAARIVALFEELRGCSRIELALTAGEGGELSPSDPAGDGQAIAWLNKLLAIAEKRAIRVSLYPHVFFWLERWQDAMRLIERIRHPLLGLAFSSFHWYAVDGSRLSEALSACAAHVHAVNICGSRKPSATSGLPASIECLDQGELDLFDFLGAWKASGYAGRIGFQGYGIGGDAYGNLERNLQAYRRLIDRLDRHPDWKRMPAET